MAVHLSPRVTSAGIGGFLLIAVMVLFWYLRPPVAPPSPTDGRPITMSPTFAGLNVSSYNNGDAPETVAFLREELDGAQFGLTKYGEPGQTVISVLATRSDLTGKIDLRMLNDNGQPYGKSRCSRNLSLRTAEEGPDDPGSPYPGKLTCWRTSERLSVSAFVLDKPPAEQELAQAVDALWESQL